MATAGERVVPTQTRDASIEQVEMNERVVEGALETVSVTEEHFYTDQSTVPPHPPPNGQRCDGWFDDVKVRMGCRIIVGGQVADEQIDCIDGTSGTLFQSEVRNTFDLQYTVPSSAQTNVIIELFWGNSGDIIETEQRTIQTGQQESSDLRIANISPSGVTTSPDGTAHLSIRVENTGDAGGTEELSVVYKGVDRYRQPVSILPHESRTVDVSFPVGSQAGSFTAQTTYGGTERGVPINVEEGASGQCEGLFSAFTSRECCPIHTDINTRLGNIQLPNLCVVGAALGAAGLILITTGGSILRIPVEITKGLIGVLVSLASKNPKLTLGAGIASLAALWFL